MKHYLLLLLFPIVLCGMQPFCTVSIPMRDGMELKADLYYPPGADVAVPQPCILIRSPAGRAGQPFQAYACKLAEAGFLVAMQETRSSVDAKGRTFPFWSDGWGVLQDGYDTVEWLALSPYTNGKIGTFGFSATGITQVMMAPSSPPSLCCQYIGIAASSLYHHAAFIGGQLLKNQVEGWLFFYAPDSGVISMLCNQPFYNQFWKSLNAMEMAHQVTVPAVHYGGWYDTFIQGTLDEFMARQEKGGEGAKGRQKLLIGPWTHHYPENPSFGEYSLPSQAALPPVDISPVAWFNHYLKGEQNKVEDLPPVTYYIMGPLDGTASKGNVWKHADVWPVPAKTTPFYLHANASLSEKISKDSGERAFVHDPVNPVPTLGGRNLFLAAGPKDQRPIECRDDVLIFTTDPLDEDTEVTGRVIAHFFVSSDVHDIDLAVRLTDVYPDGKSVLISDGIARAGFDKPGVLPVEIDLWTTSMVFAKGHRIRISLAGSNFPRYELNLHCGRVGSVHPQWLKGKIIVHTGPQHPSHILFPVIH